MTKELLIFNTFTGPFAQPLVASEIVRNAANAAECIAQLSEAMQDWPQGFADRTFGVSGHPVIKCTWRPLDDTGAIASVAVLGFPSDFLLILPRNDRVAEKKHGKTFLMSAGQRFDEDILKNMLGDIEALSTPAILVAREEYDFPPKAEATLDRYDAFVGMAFLGFLTSA